MVDLKGIFDKKNCVVQVRKINFVVAWARKIWYFNGFYENSFGSTCN